MVNGKFRDIKTLGRNQDQEQLFHVLLGGEERHLKALVKPFNMSRDVYDQIMKLYKTNEDFKENCLYSCTERFYNNLDRAIQYNSSILINVFGETRHGKSTVARHIAKIIYIHRNGTPKNWEQSIIYEHSYSGTTNKIMEQANALKEKELSKAEVINQLKGLIVIQDEVFLEHETDSIKAKNDLINLTESCAAAEIDMIFVTPKRREFGQFSLWVVGINPTDQTNLAFYFDNNFFCKGFCITNNEPESSTYKQTKIDGIFEMVSQGGRRIAEKKTFSETLVTTTRKQIQGSAPEHLLDNLIQSLGLKPSKHLQRNITIFKKVAVQGLSVGKVAKDNGLTDARVYQILGAINQAVGIAFEKYLEAIQPKMWIRQGGKSQPDLINEQHKFVISCKVMYGNKKKKTNKAVSDSKPEYAYMKQGYTGYLIIFWIDDNTFTIEPIL